MSAIDTLDPVAREICVAEIAKHREEAYTLGLAEGRKQASILAIANWLRGAAKSWTMNAGALAIATSLAAEAWPVVAEFLAGRVDPQVLGLLGAVVMALRARSIAK